MPASFPFPSGLSTANGVTEPSPLLPPHFGMPSLDTSVTALTCQNLKYYTQSSLIQNGIPEAFHCPFYIAYVTFHCPF